MADSMTPVQYLKGVGEARAKAFAKLGVETCGDLVRFFPRAYEDRTVFRTVSELEPGASACVRATVVSEPTLSYIRAGLNAVKVKVSDDTGILRITYFNMPYMRSALTAGETFVFFGKNTGTPGAPAMVNPVYDRLGAERSTGKLVPIYPLSAGLSQKTVSDAVRGALDACLGQVPEPLPEELLRRFQLARGQYAYETVHFPKSAQELEIARRRLIFEELFLFSCALTKLRGQKEKSISAPVEPGTLEEFFAALPFSLTGAQLRAIRQTASDLAAPTPMARLVQGDVGSGKTMVAAAACYLEWKSGWQSAFMAPTEILAAQHFRTLKGLLSPMGVRVGLLTGSMTAKEKRETGNQLKHGEIDILVGTHALISKGVEYQRLGLVVTDEQHRFGVQQRAALSEKGEKPNVLVMSATPIPRTLALILYGDLDVSVIDELPPGRQRVDTYAVGEDMRARIWRFIEKLVSEGRQVFIVCPKVENEDGSEDLKAVESYAEKLKTEIFPHLRVAFVHGKMKPKEKDAVMAEFASGQTDILVSTTVIEVGVDVPNAALMVVENADRFGLSQLHQLRGRVGRGTHKSYCVLFEGAGGDTAKERLQVLCGTNDGFRIAEEDLRLRGPGDFFGSRQSGLPEMRIASLATDVKLLQDAKEAAQALLREDPALEKPQHAVLRQRVEKLLRESDETMN